MQFTSLSFKFQQLTAFVQVVWLKVELCRLMEEKRSAILRLVPSNFCNLLGCIFTFSLDHI
jgi:hypothetical protein